MLRLFRRDRREPDRRRHAPRARQVLRQGQTGLGGAGVLQRLRYAVGGQATCSRSTRRSGPKRRAPRRLQPRTVLGELNTRGAGVKIALLDASRRNPSERRFRSPRSVWRRFRAERLARDVSGGAGLGGVGRRGENSLSVGHCLKGSEFRPDREEAFYRTETGVTGIERRAGAVGILFLSRPTFLVFIPGAAGSRPPHCSASRAAAGRRQKPSPLAYHHHRLSRREAGRYDIPSSSAPPPLLKSRRSRPHSPRRPRRAKSSTQTTPAPAWDSSRAEPVRRWWKPHHQGPDGQDHNIQNHGGIGFTWEHDCHLFLKRAHLLEQLLGAESGSREALLEPDHHEFR